MNLVPAFSLVRGGPTHRLARSLNLIDDQGTYWRLALLFVAVAWLPLVLLEGINFAATGDWRSSVLSDIGVHARLLVAIPLLVHGERAMHMRTERCIDRLVEGRWADQDDAALSRIVTTATRRRDALAPELVALVLAVVGSSLVAWNVLDAMGLHRGPRTAGWSAASGWYALVALPLEQFLLLRWVWRWALWVWMLVKISRLRLRPIATHPDRKGGLGFLAEPSLGLSWFLSAAVAVQAGVWANRVVYDGISVTALKGEIAMTVVIALLVALGPLCVFSPTMWRTRFAAVRQYEALAAAHSRWFQRKWIDRGEDRRELFGNGDVSAQCDLSTVYEEMDRMRLIPFGLRAILIIVGTALIPVIPVIMLQIPIGELVRKLGSVAMGAWPG